MAGTQKARHVFFQKAIMASEKGWLGGKFCLIDPVIVHYFTVKESRFDQFMTSNLSCLPRSTSLYLPVAGSKTWTVIKVRENGYDGDLLILNGSMCSWFSKFVRTLPACSAPHSSDQFVHIQQGQTYNDLAASLWIKSHKPHLQIANRVWNSYRGCGFFREGKTPFRSI